MTTLCRDPRWRRRGSRSVDRSPGRIALPRQTGEKPAGSGGFDVSRASLSLRVVGMAIILRLACFVWATEKSIRDVLLISHTDAGRRHMQVPSQKAQPLCLRCRKPPLCVPGPAAGSCTEGAWKAWQISQEMSGAAPSCMDGVLALGGKRVGSAGLISGKNLDLGPEVYLPSYRRRES